MFILSVFVFFFFLLFTVPEDSRILPTFRMTEQPDVVTKGTYGSALTVNISFGKDDVIQWLSSLQDPYPLVLADADWLERSPKAVEVMINKKIPVGLLGKESIAYETNPELLEEEIKAYEKLFSRKPLWFRTKDEQFPSTLTNRLWNHEINALGSTQFWSDSGQAPKLEEGEILSVPYHQHEKVSFKNIDALRSTKAFHSIEDVIFGLAVKTKKFPQ